MTYPRGRSHFTMESTESKIYPGSRVCRHAARQSIRTIRKTHRQQRPRALHAPVAVYVPQQYVPGTIAPFIVGADGPDQMLFAALDNLIAQKRVPR